jgi:spore coat polysaccharide biosynthesis protein SpsF
MIPQVRVVAIIQARTGSTRLPRKVLREIGGATMLDRVVRRTKRASQLSEVVVATTVEPDDDAIVTECDRLGVQVFRGSEDDVLDRYYHAAMTFKAEAVVRITSDCPLIDSSVIDEVVRAFSGETPDYASNSLTRTYPRGLDVEVMTMEALARAWNEATEPYHRVHVTPYLYQHPDVFRLLSLKAEADYSHLRWTVDTPEDLELVRSIYERLGNDDSFGWRSVLTLLADEPSLSELNRHVPQKSLEEG